MKVLLIWVLLLAVMLFCADVFVGKGRGEGQRESEPYEGDSTVAIAHMATEASHLLHAAAPKYSQRIRVCTAPAFSKRSMHSRARRTRAVTQDSSFHVADSL